MANDDFNYLKDLQIHFDKAEVSQAQDRRQAFRAVPPGVKAKINKVAGGYWVNDISAGGICMAVPEGVFLKGENLLIDLLIADKVYLANLQARVVRAFARECACAFQGITRHQELKLDKLVLEMQKRYIVKQKQAKNEEEKNAPEFEQVPFDNLRINLGTSSFT